MKRSICLLIIILLSVNLVPSSGKITAPADKPNIILVLIDDLGYGELPSYENTFNETPNIDQLAQQGMCFTNAYSSGPVCSPSRASIHTGQYTPRHGIHDFLPENTSIYLDPDKHTTINEALSSAGYTTGLIGKWHLDTDFNHNPGGPDKHGFDMVYGTETKYIAGGDYFYPYDKISTITEGETNEFLPDRLFGEADSFIRENENHPFFLSLQLYSVHMTLQAPEDLVTKYKEKYELKYGEGSSAHFDDGEPRINAGFPDNPYLAGMLERIDAGVGKLVGTLRELNLDENTILIVTSDNGGDEFVANNGGLREAKTWLYEGGIKIPMIIYYPGHCLEGVKNKTPVNFVDFYPTFLELANASTDQILDGVSMVPLLQNNPIDRDELYWWYPTSINAWTNRKASVIRKGDYKLIYRYGLSPDLFEMYNLAEDPFEEHDLYQEEPEKATELKQKLENWMADMKYWSSYSLPETFEESSVASRWRNAHDAGAPPPSIVENPSKIGINTSDSVMLWVKAKDSQVYAAAMSDFGYDIQFNGDATYIHVKMMKNNTDPCALQVIRTNDGGSEAGKYPNPPPRIPCPTPNAWVDYVFEFSDTAATDYNWSRLYFMPAMNATTPGGWTADALDADVNVYIDDIIIDSDSSSYGSNVNTVFVDKKGNISYILNNPVTDELIMDGLDTINEVKIYAINGKLIRNINTENTYTCRIPVSDLTSGIYLVSFLEENGNSAVSRIVKR